MRDKWNKGAERIFGYTAEEAIGQPITIIIPEDRHDEERQILTRIRRGERIDHFETVRRRKHGSLIIVSLTVSPVKDAEGKIVGASKIARDITEQKSEAKSKSPRSLAKQSTEARICWRPYKQPYTFRNLELRRSQTCNRRAHPGTRKCSLAICQVSLDWSRAIRCREAGTYALYPKERITGEN